MRRRELPNEYPDWHIISGRSEYEVYDVLEKVAKTVITRASKVENGTVKVKLATDPNLTNEQWAKLESDL